MENKFDRIYKNPQFLRPWNYELKEFPFVVDVELTNYCNLACRMCPHPFMKREKGHMTEETFKKVADECAEYGAAMRIIRWGEHLLHQQVFDFIAYAKSKGLIVHMTTNGLLLGEAEAEKIIKSGLDSIIFSMQGATKGGYEEMRNNNKYDLLEKNIVNLASLRRQMESDTPYIHISSTMTSETLEEVQAFKDKWGKVADSVGTGLTTFEYVDVPEKSSSIDKLKGTERIKKEYRPCSEVLTKLSVNWNGDVTACCGDFDNFLILGNIADQTLKQLWNCEKLEKIRKILGNMEMEKLPLCNKCYATYEELRPQK